MFFSIVRLLSVWLFVTPWLFVTTRFLHPWDFQGKKTGVGCHFLLQEIFPTQGLNLGLPHCRQTLYHLSHQGMQGKKTYFNELLGTYGYFLSFSFRNKRSNIQVDEMIKPLGFHACSDILKIHAQILSRIMIKMNNVNYTALFQHFAVEADELSLCCCYFKWFF